MNKKKFLEKLGITSGEWKNNNGIIAVGSKLKDCVCQTWDKYEKDYSNVEINSKLICAAPDMLITLILAAMQFNKYAIEHFTKGKMEKWGTNNYYFKHLREVIEKATYKTWNEIIEIWEECQE